MMSDKSGMYRAIQENKRSLFTHELTGFSLTVLTRGVSVFTLLSVQELRAQRKIETFGEPLSTTLPERHQSMWLKVANSERLRRCIVFL